MMPLGLFGLDGFEFALNKPSRLTDEEYGVMKSHSQRGYDVLKNIDIAPKRTAKWKTV